ncbi:TcdA/TcdB catalytic glycosyltransferase domain-containing protein [Spiroplasma sp. DGKH1]|uniref:TcdA/TcdB catalytic glycosyltransferase domain-containing protein n=1 Tax=Spiroplasma sp. DGKH1 TaxID=3050074 RepID=UPI0034C5B373
MLLHQDIIQLRELFYTQSDTFLKKFAPTFDLFFNNYDTLTTIEQEQYLNALHLLCIREFKDNYETNQLFQLINHFIRQDGKLETDEKNIHYIWYGLLEPHQTNCIKVWTYYNPDYQINLWTNFDSSLVNLLHLKIKEAANNDLAKIIKLQNEFYHDYYLKHQDASFNENVKQFLVNKKLMLEFRIEEIIQEIKESFYQVQQELQKFTHNQVIIREINEETLRCGKVTYWFLNKELNLRQHIKSVSNRLRYLILRAYGGIYLDWDVLPSFNKKMLASYLLNFQDNDRSRLILKREILMLLNNQDLLDYHSQRTVQMLTLISKSYLQIFLKHHQPTSPLITSESYLEGILSEIIDHFGFDNLIVPLGDYIISNGYHIMFGGPNDFYNDKFLIAKKNSVFLNRLILTIQEIDKYIEQKTYDLLSYNNQTLSSFYHDLLLQESNSNYLNFINYRFDYLIPDIKTATSHTGSKIISFAFANLFINWLKKINENIPNEFVPQIIGEKIRLQIYKKFFCYNNLLYDNIKDNQMLIGNLNWPDNSNNNLYHHLARQEYV